MTPIKTIDEELGLAPAKPTPAPQASPWEVGPGGVMSRNNPVSGRTEFVENVGGTVMSWSRPYTPPPVDKKKSFAELLISDIPARENLMRQKLLKGDIPGAEAERDQLIRFIDENQDVLHRFAKYRGTDAIAKRVSEKAVSLATKDFLTPGLSDLFDPRLNPKSAENEALNRGMGAAATGFLSSARYGQGPEAAEAMAVMDFMPGKATAAKARQGRPDEASLPDGVSDFNGWAEHYRDASAKLKSSLPQSVLSQFSPDRLVRLVRTGYEAGDQASNGALINIAADAANKATELDDLGKANLFEATLHTAAGLMKDMGAGDNPVAQAQAAKVISSIQQILPGSAFEAKKSLVARAASSVMGYVKDAEASDVSMRPDALTSMTSAFTKRELGRTDLSDRESRILTAHDRATALSAGVQVSDDPTLPSVETAQGAKAPQATVGHGILQSAVQQAVKEASLIEIGEDVDRRQALDRAAAKLSPLLVATSKGKDRNAADLASRVVLRILDKQGSIDVRNLNAEIAKYPELQKTIRQEAMEVVTKDPAVAAKTFKGIRERLPAGSVDSFTAEAADELEEGKAGDMAPGSPEFNQAFEKFTAKGPGTLARELTGTSKAGPATSSALTYLFGVKAEELESSAVQTEARRLFKEQAHLEGNNRTAAKIKDKNIEALGDAFVKNQVELIKSKIGDPKASGERAVSDALGSETVKSWNAAKLLIDMKMSEAEDVGWLGRLGTTSGPGQSFLPAKAYSGMKVERNTEAGGFDYAATAAYMFLNEALGKDGQPGVVERDSETMRLFGFGTSAGAAGGARALSGIPTRAAANATKAAASAKTLGELAAGASQIYGLPALSPLETMSGAEASLLRTSENLTKFAAKARPIVGVGSKLLNEVAAAAGVGTVLYDALASSQVPVDDGNVARRIKGYVISDFENVGGEPVKRPAAAGAASLSAFAPRGQAEITGAAGKAKDAAPLLGVEDIEPAGLLEAREVLNNTAKFLDKPVMDAVMRRFFEKDIETRYSTRGGLRGEYFWNTVSNAYSSYSPDKPWREFLKETDAFAAGQMKAQTEALLQLRREQAKASAEGRFEGTPDDSTSMTGGLRGNSL